MLETHELADDLDVGEIGRRDLSGDGTLLNDHDALRERGYEVEVLLNQNDGEIRPLLSQRRQRVDDLVDPLTSPCVAYSASKAAVNQLTQSIAGRSLAAVVRRS